MSKKALLKAIFDKYTSNPIPGVTGFFNHANSSTAYPFITYDFKSNLNITFKGTRYLDYNLVMFSIWSDESNYAKLVQIGADLEKRFHFGNYFSTFPSDESPDGEVICSAKQFENTKYNQETKIWEMKQTYRIVYVYRV